jgi:hypothetical protein
LNNNKLSIFINLALNSNINNKSFTIEISDLAIKNIKNTTKLNITDYKFIIKEEYIRHIKNRHYDDMKYLTEIPNILNNFDEVEKSITRNTQTGQNEISIVFRKKLDNNKIQMVALRALKDKVLSLKTLFSLNIKK